MMPAKYFCECGRAARHMHNKRVGGATVGDVRKCDFCNKEFVFDLKTGRRTPYTCQNGHQSFKQRSENSILNSDRKKFGNQRIPVAMRVVARENNDPPKQIAPIPEEWAKQAEIRHKIEDRRMERDLIGKDLW